MLKQTKKKLVTQRMNPSDEYKLTDLDYLIGDHHLQMIKAALPYLNVPEQRAVSLFVKFQELRRTFELFETEEVASRLPWSSSAVFSPLSSSRGLRPCRWSSPPYRPWLSAWPKHYSILQERTT